MLLLTHFYVFSCIQHDVFVVFERNIALSGSGSLNVVNLSSITNILLVFQLNHEAVNNFDLIGVWASRSGVHFIFAGCFERNFIVPFWYMAY